ncbi:hypothetical protein BDE02_04G172700 [Populus trichocarpa]|nr:hypothetical protein BDE02_04G172700 [Populus trichocarpa]
MEKVVAEAEELPKAIVCRMVKDALSRCSPDESESLHFHPLSFRHGSWFVKMGFVNYFVIRANDMQGIKEANNERR